MRSTGKARLPEITSPIEALGPLLGRLADVSLPLLALGLAFQMLKIGAMSQVWRRILREAFPAARIRRRDALLPYVAGVGINAVVPAKAGLVARCVLMKRRLPGASYEALTMTMVVESVVGTVATLGLLAVAAGTGVVPSPQGPLGSAPHLLSVVPGGTVAVAAAGLVALAVGVLAGRRLRGRLADTGRRLRQGAAVLGHGRALGEVMLGVGVVWLMRASCIAAFLAAFGIDASPRTVLLVVLAQMLSGMVPVGPNGAGAQQGLMVLLLAGVATAPAILTFAIGMQAAIAVLDVVAASIALAAHGNPLRVVRELRAASDEPALAPAT